MFKRPTWEESFMLHAILTATRSSCLVRRCGAVLVRDKRIIASGYNGAPPGIETCLDTGVCFYQDLAYVDSIKGLGTYEHLKEERKEFCIVVHAEKNAFNQCSKLGIEAEGSILYSTNFPCPRCTIDVIVPNKIREIFVWKDFLSNPLLTMDEFKVSEHILKQAKIAVKKVELSEERIMEIIHESLNNGNRLPYRFDPGQSRFSIL
jgi:dCMP deaminase